MWNKISRCPRFRIYLWKYRWRISKKRRSGEICIRGPIVFKGYFRNEEKTKEYLDEDGWLHSGDIDTIIPEQGNAIKIVDRLKNIFKLQQGEYISSEKIENIYSGCKYIEQIFIYGDSIQFYLLALFIQKHLILLNLWKQK